MPPAIRQLLILLATILAQITMARSADVPLVVDIHNDHIEAELTLPATGKSPTESTRAALATDLQTHLTFTTREGDPMTYELVSLKNQSPDTLQAILFIYPPNDTTPASFKITSTTPNQRLQILLRRDPAEMRLGIEPQLSLGTIDSFKNSLTIEREFPPLESRALSAFTIVLQALLSQSIPILLILLLLATALTQHTKVAPAFTLAALAALAFSAGTFLAIHFQTQFNPTLTTALLALALAALSCLVWKPIGPAPILVTSLATGWITGVSWNATWLLPSSLPKETLLLISAAPLPALLAITLIALPSLLLLSRQLPPRILRNTAALCGIFVILIQLTALARHA